MKPPRIWFNRTYATSYWLLRQLIDNPEQVPVEIYATHVERTSPVLAAAHVSELEPELSGEAYVAWALAFCERHQIDLLFPRVQQVALAAATERFAQLGVTVLTSPAPTVALFEDKGATYRAASAQGLAVPPYRVASGAAALAAAHASLTAEVGAQVPLVIKPTVGVGAEGFRIIAQRPYALSDLLAVHDPQVAFEQVLAACARAEAAGETTPELMLLPLLDNPEISVDVLSGPDGQLLSALPRVKETSRVTRFTPDPAALRYVQQLHASNHFAYLTNAQFMWWRGELVLLEVNTRPSGGLFAASATGVNYVWEAVRLALGREARVLTPRFGDAFAQVPAPIAL